MRQLCTFTVADQWYGVDVAQVQEVLRYQPMARVPLAPEVVTGLLNIRGQVVTAIDLRKRLRLTERAAREVPTNVVVKTDDGIMSLLVDDIGDVIEVTGETFEPPPPTIAAGPRQYLRGVYKLEGRLLLVLDIDRVVGIQELTAASQGVR